MIRIGVRLSQRICRKRLASERGIVGRAHRVRDSICRSSGLPLDYEIGVDDKASSGLPLDLRDSKLEEAVS
jgi:hypothetical protein